MSERKPDPDLLFGILALQNGFIDQAALIAAFRPGSESAFSG